MPNLNEQKFAEDYGFAYAFLKSSPEIYKLFKNAVATNMAPAAFVSKLQETEWYRKHSESWRKYQLLKGSDPATLAQRKSQLISQLRDSAAEMGSLPSADILSRIADNALMFEWNDAQLRDVLSGYVRSTHGVFSGAAQDTSQQLHQIAWKNGLKFSPATYESWAQKVAGGSENLQHIQALIRNQAKTLAPAYADALDNGQDLFDVASPYIQAKARILEKNPADIDLFDNDIRQALSGKDTQGKPASQSLWQFEQSMRARPEWTKTKNAQDSLNAAAHRVISDFFGGA